MAIRKLEDGLKLVHLGRRSKICTGEYVVFAIGTTGKNPWYGDRVTCIYAEDQNKDAYYGVCPPDLEYVFKNTSELAVIDRFQDWLDERKDSLLVSFGGTSAQVPYVLSRKSILHNMKGNIPQGESLLEMRHLDLKRLMNHEFALEALVDLHRIPQKDYFTTKDVPYELLGRVCQKNVHDIEDVYKAYVNMIQTGRTIIIKK